MNLRHLRAFLWLRWRLRVNQVKRAGTVNAVILAILAVGAVVLGAVAFVASFLIGTFVLRQASPTVLLFVWDGLVLALLAGWSLGVISELQRAEVLALDKFLHLPVSVTGAFLINYLSSLFSLNLIVFVPAMTGLGLGLVISRGPAMLLLFPLLAAFLLMVTALTYQFQGWLASLMVNQRRRRTIIVLVTAAFILMCQVPNLLNMSGWRWANDDDLVQLHQDENAELSRAVAVPHSPAQARANVQREAAIKHKYQVLHDELKRKKEERLVRRVQVANAVLPPGWLPLGALGLAQGQLLYALLGTLGLGLIGTASLWRAYRTTVRLYSGQFSGAKRRPPATPRPVQTRRRPSRLLERRLPGLSEQASAIALGSFRSLSRAPEAKMMVLSPIILMVLFGAMLFRQSLKIPEAVLPLMAFSAMAMILFSMVQFIGNQFGFDRAGFRVYVLCPAQRREVLLGKNVAVAPLALGMGVLVAGVLQAVHPMRIDHFLALLPQFVAMYLVFCVVANWLAILVPVSIPAGSFRPANVRGMPMLLHTLFVLVLPPLLAPLLLPLGVDALLEWQGWLRGVPTDLVLSLVECVLIWYVYRLVLTWQGRLLQAREQKILETVTAKAS